MMKLKPQTLAMILAGGRVDELNVLTYYRPKSAVPFGGFARVIDFSLSNLMRSGLDRVAILSQYRSYSLINHIGRGLAWDMVGRYRGVSILPPFTGSKGSSWYRGTADAVYQNLDFVQYHAPREVLIISGDHIYNMDYRAIIEYHRAKDADLTMACLKVDMGGAHRFGVADIDDEDGELGGRVVNYAEKPTDPEYNWASMTVYCFKPAALYDILGKNAKEDDSFEFGRDIIPKLLANGARIYGYKFADYWGYTRTIEEFWQTNMDLLGDKPKIDLEKWGIRTNLEHRDIREYEPMIIGNSASLKDSLAYNGCVIEGEVSRSILFPGVHIGKGAVVKDSVLFFDTKVGANVELNKVVSDVNVTIGADCIIGGGLAAAKSAATVIGWNNKLPVGLKIGAGCTLNPHLEPEKLADEIGDGQVII